MKSELSIINQSREDVTVHSRSPVLSSLISTPWQRVSMVYRHQKVFERPDDCMPMHTIAIFTTSGIAEQTIDGIKQIGSNVPGDIAIIPANICHRSRWQSTANLILIGLEDSLFTETIDDAPNFHPAQLLPQFPTADPLIYELGLSLKSLVERDPTGSRLYAETAAAMLAVHLLQHYTQCCLELKDYADGLPRSTLCRVFDYIQANLDRDLGLTDLAKIAYLSPHYFTRLFKQSTGFTPHQFVIKCRVERAKILLGKGQDSIADIAQQVGFANQAHLNVHFKRLFGITPNAIFQQRTNL